MRLIDADKLLYDDEEFSNGKIYMVVHAPQIDNVPTAYDVKKVVEQLKEMAEFAENKALECDENGNNDCIIWKTRAKTYGNAIEIVKSGGVTK